MKANSGLSTSLPGLSLLYAGLLMFSSPIRAADPATGAERYQIQDGDTLSHISQRLFGDARYWPKLHSWNQDSIANPHLIFPGNWVLFTPGTDSSLPTVAVASGNKPNYTPPEGNAEAIPSAPRPQDELATSSARSRSRRRATEWKDLPTQAWESMIPKLPSNVDSLGFDKSNKIFFKQTQGFELDAIAASDRLPPLGQIIASSIPAQYLTLGDNVYIRPDGADLKIGETYAITREPYRLKSPKSDRDGYSYLMLGKVKIIGAKDDLFLGTITAGKHLIPRGSELVPMPAPIPQMAPIPGPAAVEGRLLIDRNLATYTSAQHKLVFVNRGASDGVQTGMIFRCYEHYDPSNDKRITSSDLIVDADVMVVQVSRSFSTALVLHSTTTVSEDAPVTLLMDVSELRKRFGFGEMLSGEKQKTNELDELDGVGGGLGPDERRELEQLERWKGNPSEQPTDQTAPAPDSMPTPEAMPTPQATPTPEAPPTADPAPPSPASSEEMPPPPAPEDAVSKETQDLDKLLDQ